jgi:hypothetical protein
MAESELVLQAAEELYGLPPDAFTSARDARAKELRKQGEHETADAVKGLRKPTVAAWALNQLARGRPKDVERLLSAGDELRAAQEELLAGGERSAFQEAASIERELVAQLSADAATLASEAGQRSGGLPEKLTGTLHAAALDEETAQELRAGRLTRERDAIGGFGGVATAAPGRAARTARSEPAPPEAGGRRAARAKPAAERGRSTDAAKRPRSKGADKRTRSKGAADRAADDARHRQRLAAARTDERHAQRELDAATRALEHAQERADAAAAHAAEAAERARTTAERLKQAKRAEAAARKARTRASRALESAERKS